MSGGRSRLARFWHEEGEPSLISSARSFQLPIGSRLDPAGLGGYHVDLSVKATSPTWPPEWLPARDRQYHVATAQWGLGCFERFLAGDGEEWLAAATGAARYLADEQAGDGGWYHLSDMPHTYRLPAPWISAMAQGEAASLLVRVHAETGEGRLAEAAVRALEPMTKPTGVGGVAATLNGGFFPEEYPTAPASFVLNGGIFAIWGCRDVAVATGDARAKDLFERGVETLAANIDLFDTGSWSLYDLYPHRIPNVASSAYHALHISQLRALHRIAPRDEFAAAADRFEAYQHSKRRRGSAFARKAAFRIINPRNTLAARLRTRMERLGGDHTLILCYHAISRDWTADLSIHPDELRRQLAGLMARGYRATSLTAAQATPAAGKRVVVTFDDAFASVGTLAKPILDELGIPGVVFVPTGPVSDSLPLAWAGTSQWLGGPFEHELEPLSWEDLSALADSGWEIGSHTVSHPHLTQLESAKAAIELSESRLATERAIGRACPAIAYPYGDVSDDVAKLAADAGYVTGVGLSSDLQDRGALWRPRVGIYHGDHGLRFRAKVSPWICRLRARPWFGPFMARVRRLLSAVRPGP